ncbi:MAG: C40 family peptidase [Bacilli bacterium]|nr:C40 family peptidase [Bacilli bacterium]
MFILKCNEALGTCCNDKTILPLLKVITQALDVLQILVPILLLAMAMFQMSKMVIFPDDKKQLKSLYNKFIAAVIVFLLPIVVSVTLNIVSEGSTTFDAIECLNEARNSNDSVFGGSYKDTGGKPTLLLQTQHYETGEAPSGNGNSNTSTDGKSKIIEYAKQFVGGKYCKTGKDPHKCADCVGFVMYLLNKFNTDPKHHKVTPYMPMPSQPHPELYTPVSKNDIQAGDIVTYTHAGGSHHVAMFTGNGDEIIHAANPKKGIIITKHYSKSGVEGIYRFKYLKK